MDNDKQKSTENNSSARPGIFSTPDLTIDTEKLTQAAPSTDANKARIASVFANTDATRQAQQSVITSAPLEGDVIINNVPKKRRKWPIIVLAVVAVSIIALVVVLIISQTGQKSAYEKVKTAFLEYANFTLHGEVSTSELDISCIEEKTCYFTQAMRSKEQFEKFYDDSMNLSKKLQETVTAWNATVTTDNKDSETDNADNSYDEDFEMTPANKEILIQELEGLVDIYNFMPMFAAHEPLTENSIIDYYLKNGESKTQAYITDHYETGTGNKHFDELNQGGLVMGEAVLDNIKIYARHECLQSIMNTACFLSQATEEEKEEVSENNTIIASYSAEMSVYSKMPNQFVNRIREINILFNRYESERK